MICVLQFLWYDFWGITDGEAVQELLSECIKMKDLNHLHVMTLKGVCLDGGPVPFIVLPYMANGSLLSYLKKERSNLTVPTAEGDSSEEEKQVQVSTIIWKYDIATSVSSSHILL